MHIDSKAPSVPYRDFARSETRFSALQRTHPQIAEELLREAQEHVEERFQRYEQLAQLAVDRVIPPRAKT